MTRAQDEKSLKQILQNVKLIMFDWSGVISDDRVPVYEAAQRLYDIFGIQRVERKKWFRESLASAREDFVRKGVVAQPEDIFNAYVNIFAQVIEEGIVPQVYLDAPKVLEHLSRKIKLAVISSHPQTNLTSEAKRYGIFDHFSLLEGSVKDKSLAMPKVSETLDIPLVDSLYIGDTVTDIQSAQKAGVKVIGITTGYHDYDQLALNQPAFIIHKLSDLLL